jgi:hypothetical protein
LNISSSLFGATEQTHQKVMIEMFNSQRCIHNK